MSDETVRVCPECDTAHDLYRRQGKPQGNPEDTTETYRCLTCGAEFDTLKRRSPERDGHGRRGMAGRLANATPEELDL
jgi:rubredoxin